MSGGAVGMVVVIALTFGALVFVVHATIRSIEVHRSRGRSVWREFGLGLGLMILFFLTWLGHGIAQWQTATDEATSHGESLRTGDFVAEFAQSTLENWQSEFLQLFSFVTLAALYIHKGSAESKDGDERLEASLRRIEERLGTLPPVEEDKAGWELPDTPLHEGDRDAARAGRAARR